MQYGLINVEAKVLLFQFIPEEGVSGVMRGTPCLGLHVRRTELTVPYRLQLGHWFTIEQ